MSIKITWTNDDVVDEIKIYRSDSRIDLATLPEPLAVIAGTEVEFVDVTARRSQIYYYVVAKIKEDSALGANDGEVLYSPNSVHGYYPETGHGTNLIKRGDWVHGYFGIVSPDEFFSNPQLCQDIRAKTEKILTPLSEDPIWHKFIYQGKILFVPQMSVTSTAISWRELYHMGAVFGDEFVDGTFPPALDYVPTKQGLTLELDGYTYKVRLMRFTSGDSIEGISDDDLALTLGVHSSTISNSEYFQTVSRLLASDYDVHKNGRLDNLMNLTANGASRLGQELKVTVLEDVRTPTKNVTVGGTSGNEQILATVDTELQVANRYHPVLELVL